MDFLKKSLNAIVHILSKNMTTFLLILIAIFLRFYKLSEFTTFLGDQGRDAIIIKRIVTFQHFPAIGAPTSIGQIFLGPFYYYFIAPFLLLFNFNPVGLTYGVAFLSIVGLIFGYFIISKYLSKPTALVFLSLAVFSHTLIEYSRFSWNPNLLPIFSFLALYFMYLILKRDKLTDFVILGALISFSVQLHYLGIFLFFPLLFTLVYKVILKKNSFNIKNICAGLISCLLCSSPLIIFDLKHQFLNSKNFLNLIFKKEVVVSQGSILIRILNTNKEFYNHVFKLEFSNLIAIIITLLLSFLIFRSKKNSFVVINTVNFLSFIVLFSFLNSSRFPHYYGQVYFSFFLILAVILSSIRIKIKYVMITILIIFYAFFNMKNYGYFIEEGSRQIERAKRIAMTFKGKIDSRSFLVVPEPFTESADPVKYFLEVDGHTALPDDFAGQPDELFLMCHLKDCVISGNPQWQLSAFNNPKIDKIWNIEGIKIYKIVHGK